MGVYVFECGNYIKVGHHSVTNKRPNVYYRVSGLGFNSCLHPPELSGRLRLCDIKLLAWYPFLTTRDEMCIHHTFPHRIGEFHVSSDCEAIVQHLDKLGTRVDVSDDERTAAIKWAANRRVKINQT